ncbi:PQ-loop repeat-containing protein 2 [Myriangium duriaei CBS 260.36]|uniref:PQ-loop repeat-containing protein 2 n=1 Tax=Myriangium duriaei CBS 260.36 TaxID=1168546 RepID=A0A9P4MCJ1_9PEZI|nr:PQ-loop repeat-containing protein 2 [Myriangium duriaei CBS 260.36]
MSWTLTNLVPQSQLPPRCHPTSDFLQQWSLTFHVCVPTNLAFISSILGCLSIVSWLFAQLPQIYKNYCLASTTGLSIYFLVEWCLGDLGNLFGALFTGQATWQVIIAGYYCFVDLVLVFQWFWYEHLRHGWTIRSYWVRSWEDGGGNNAESYLDGLADDGRSVSDASSIRSGDHILGKSVARDIYSPSGRLTPNWRNTPEEKFGGSFSSPRRLVQMQASSSAPGPSPRTILFIACLISLCRASPIITDQQSSLLPAAADGKTPIEVAGTILSWMSTALYLGSRLPQLYKNYKRQSTSGLSPQLFIAAFLGNLFYSSSLIANPLAWYDFDSYGGGGWAGAAGSVRKEWVLKTLPFFLGAAGVLILDGLMGVQFLMYGEAAKVVVIEEVDERRKRRRWKKVSGWMRGWIPSFGEAKKRNPGQNRRPLVTEERRQDRQGYGTI